MYIKMLSRVVNYGVKYKVFLVTPGVRLSNLNIIITLGKNL